MFFCLKFPSKENGGQAFALYTNSSYIIMLDKNVYRPSKRGFPGREDRQICLGKNVDRQKCLSKAGVVDKIVYQICR
jgi:hypothetical protein